MVIANLGLSPWDVLHQGISRQTGIPIGTVVIITGFAVLLLWIPLKERIGIGTIANAIVIGLVLDGALLVLPETLDNLVARWLALLVGVAIVAIGSGFYIGAGLGPGPHDGLMTGLARHGISIAWARAGSRSRPSSSGGFSAGPSASEPSSLRSGWDHSFSSSSSGCR